jgi:hypothetical protein
LTDDHVLLNKRPVDSSNFEKHITKYLLNTSYRKRHKITNDIQDDEIWLKIGIVHISGDSMGVDVNGQFYKFNENYRKIKIKKGRWNSIDGAWIVLIPKKIYNDYFFSEDPGRLIYRADTNFKPGMGYYRFKFTNAPEIVKVEQVLIYEIPSKDTDYIATLGTMNKYRGIKTFDIIFQDTIQARFRLHFSMNEMYTISFDFSSRLYKIKFDGYSDVINEPLSQTRLITKKRNYTWPDWNWKSRHKIRKPSILVENYY